MNGLDAVVFTAGIGENSAMLRRMVCEDMDWLGIELDETANERACCQSDAVRISKEGAPVALYVIPTNEELMIAKDTAALLAQR